MRSPFTWGSLAAAALAPESTPWYARVGIVAAGLTVAMVTAVMDYRLRRLAIEKVPAGRVVDVVAAQMSAGHRR